jgi:type IV pilus assembly protein PilB
MEEALRSVVAVRPDVLMISNVPDRATAVLAAQLSSSILVIASLPGQSAAGAIQTFLELGVPPHMLSNSLSAVTCQRLVRQICRICRVDADAPSPQTLALQGISAEEAQRLKFFRGKGCPSCNKVGYRGRRAIFEVLSGVPEVRAAILNGMPSAEIESLAMGAGMKRLRERCLELVSEGVTTFDEFTRLRLSS